MKSICTKNIEKKNYSFWTDLSGRMSTSFSESSVIKCAKCGYITNPSVKRWKEDGVEYGLLRLPSSCKNCGALMNNMMGV
jgi:hypothetical protein